MPQKWQKHWPVAAEDFEAAQRRDAHVHRLGNLTLVTSKLNPSMSNAAWATKKSALNEHSILLLNSRVVGAHPMSWDEERSMRDRVSSRVESLGSGRDLMWVSIVG